MSASVKTTARKATAPRAGKAAKVSSGRASSGRSAKQRAADEYAEFAAMMSAQSAAFDLIMAQIDEELDRIDIIVGRKPARPS
jgi:hypothetical protein